MKIFSKIVTKNSQTEKDNSLVHFIYFLLCIYIASPFFTLPVVEIRRNYLLVILLYSTIVRVVGSLILISSPLLLHNYKKTTFRQLLPAILFAVYYILAFISCMLAQDVDLAVFGNNRGEGYFTYLAYAGMFLGGFLVVLYDKKLLEKMIRLMVFTSAIFALIAINDRFFPPIYGIHENLLIISAFANANYYGYYLAITLMLSIHLLINSKSTKSRILYSVATLAILFASYLARCRGALLAFVIGFIIYSILQVRVMKKAKYKKYIFIGLAVSAIAGIVLNIATNWQYVSATYDSVANAIAYFNDPSYTGAANTFVKRYKMYQAAMETTLQKPLLGYGLENITDILTRAINQGANRCHNEILQRAATTGIPATVAYLSAILIILVRFAKKVHTMSPVLIAVFTSTIIYFISSQFGVSTVMVAPYFFMLLGICYGATYEPQHHAQD